MLSTNGTAPRTAQAAMRHSDIKLTMGTYTDPKLLEVREAMERLPSLNGSDIQTKTHVALHVALLPDNRGQNGAIAGKMERESNCEKNRGRRAVNPCNVNEKGPVTSCDITEPYVGPGGFEPPTSCTPSKRASQAALRPETEWRLKSKHFGLKSSNHSQTVYTDCRSSPTHALRIGHFSGETLPDRSLRSTFSRLPREFREGICESQCNRLASTAFERGRESAGFSALPIASHLRQ